jgi:hypothetical protein
MFTLSDTTHDILDEIVLFPERWEWDSYNFWHKRKRINFWTSEDLGFFNEESSGIKSSYIEKYTLRKTIRQVKAEEAIKRLKN